MQYSCRPWFGPLLWWPSFMQTEPSLCFVQDLQCPVSDGPRISGQWQRPAVTRRGTGLWCQRCTPSGVWSCGAAHSVSNQWKLSPAPAWLHGSSDMKWTLWGQDAAHPLTATGLPRCSGERGSSRNRIVVCGVYLKWMELQCCKIMFWWYSLMYLHLFIENVVNGKWKLHNVL